jgi:hypothetical protein
MTARLLLWLAAAATTALLTAGVALAHPEEAHAPEPEPMQEEVHAPPAEAPMDHDEPVPDRTHPELMLHVPDRAEPGTPVRVEAVLRGPGGAPVEGAGVDFVTTGAWGEWLRGEVVLATATTDESGRAVASVDLRAADEAEVIARFAGDDRREPASDEAVVAVARGQAHRNEVGITVPGLTVWWLIGAVILVWSLFLVVALRTLAIARAGADVSTGRRRFFGRYLAPVGMAAVAASLGSGLVALITRSPRTHANLGAVADHVEAGHRLPPIARLGEQAALRPLPPLLDRQVSFSHDVLPILRAKAGPHAHPPTHSPAPHGVRLDSYAHIMETPGLVQAGEPADSRLVTVLLDPAVQMPPSVPPLPEEEIRVIASWVAQGARDN